MIEKRKRFLPLVEMTGVKVGKRGLRKCAEKCQNQREGANEKVLKNDKKQLKSEKFC